MVAAFEYYENAELVASDGVFFGVGASLGDGLAGIEPTELLNAVDTFTKEGKFGLSFFGMLQDYLATNPALGLTVALAEATPDQGLTTSTYTITNEWVSNLATGTVEKLPVPTVGANLDVGRLLLTDVFSNAVKLNSGDAAPDNGVLVPSTVISNFSTLTHATIDLTADNRDFIAAVSAYFCSQVEIRDADNATGVTAATLPLYVGSALPAGALDAVDPTTGLNPANANAYMVNTQSSSISLETEKNYILQSFDLRVVTL